MQIVGEAVRSVGEAFEDEICLDDCIPPILVAQNPMILHWLCLHSVAQTNTKLSSNLSLEVWLMSLWTINAVLWLTCAFLDRIVEPVSRRACNAAYIFWMMAHNLSVLLVCILVEVLGPGEIPRLLGAPSRNMLFVFLAANVLTGLVNISMNTLEADGGTARIVTGRHNLLSVSANETS